MLIQREMYATVTQYRETKQSKKAASTTLWVKYWSVQSLRHNNKFVIVFKFHIPLQSSRQMWGSVHHNNDVVICSDPLFQPNTCPAGDHCLKCHNSCLASSSGSHFPKHNRPQTTPTIYGGEQPALMPEVITWDNAENWDTDTGRLGAGVTTRFPQIKLTERSTGPDHPRLVS